MSQHQAAVRSALSTTIAIVAIITLLRWAWLLLQPLLPVLGIAIGIFVVTQLVVVYRRHW